LRGKVKLKQKSYKVVECNTVTDEELEKIMNEWAPQGFELETIHFATREASKRPAMAFLFFTKVTNGKG